MVCTDDHGKPVSILEATRWSLDTPMSDAHLRQNWLALQRMVMSDGDIRASEWDLYGPHSFGANIIRAQLRGNRFDTVGLCEVSRWSGPGESALRGTSVPIRYTVAAGGPVELDLRRRLCRSVPDFIGERKWQGVIPRQLGGVPPFNFLLGEAKDSGGRIGIGE